ncbi:hypothetical protein YH65_10230 [Sulfurovum lithotrophicum]|uniref:Sulfotransferase domain-containing protein n=1 Tax=Sulfurovum lithotrophicum TaxID=206403 RepID=A0A7U4M2L5_9BACT|nr:hypothetical protein [Sulfurovum lithotrophicum]AKF25720.1 hypothetical protein YH65_10230 [Sulfurovum lithotrophicum]
MKRKCIIHIGMHKTGSSSIQQSLFHNLKDDTFSYLDMGIPNHSISMSMLFRNSSRKNPETVNLKNKLIKSIKNSHSIMIISAEAISMFSKEDLKYLRDFLLDYFKEIQIVGYIRSPKSYMESFFQQRVKGGLVSFDLEKYIYPNYRKRFEKFDDVFGHQNVQFWKFDPKHFYKGNVVLDFCRKIGIDFQEDQTIRINESLSREEVAILYTYGKQKTRHIQSPAVMQKNMKIIKKIKKLKEHKFRFSPTLITPILEKNSRDIQWMEERLGISLKEKTTKSEADVKSEVDLLKIDKKTLQKLRILTGELSPKEDTYDDSQEEIITLINILQKANKPKKMGSTPLSLAKKLKQKHKNVLKEINEDQIATVIEKTFSHVEHQLRNTDGYRINIPQLGSFDIQILKKQNTRGTISFSQDKITKGGA